MAWRLPKTRIVLIVWLIAVAAVVTGSLLPAATLSRLRYDVVAPNDKIVHFMGYTVLAVLPTAFFELLGMGLALAASMIPMGVLLEFLQRLVPGRSFELGDMLADTLGVITGILAALWIRTLLKRIPIASRR